MRTFEKFSKDTECPVCGTNKDGRCILIPIDGTEKGNIVEAQLFHLDCIGLRYNKKVGVIYQKFRKVHIDN